jgi:hypothetical protein
MFNHVQPGDQAFDALQALQWTLASGRVNRKKKTMGWNTQAVFESVRICQHDIDET